MIEARRTFTRRAWLKGAGALGLSAAGLSIVAACAPAAPSNQSPTSPPAPAPTGQTVAPATAAQPVTLTVLVPEHWKVVEGLRANSKETVPPRRLWFYERQKQWEQAHPETTFQWQTAQWEQIPTNFITASQANNPPDLVTFDAGYLYAVASGGYLAPLDGFKYDEWDDFNPYVQNEILTIDGKKYGLSNYLASWGLMYNKALLKDAGFVEPPKTWDEVLTQGKALTKDTRGTGQPDQWGFGALMMGQLNQTPPEHLATMVWSQGGEIMDKDRRALIDTAEMRKAVEQLVDLVNASVMPKDVISMKANDEIDLMSNKVWATGLLTTSYYPPVTDKLGKENVGFTYYPKFPGGQDVGPVEVFAWHMARKTAGDQRRAQAAFDWMKFQAANETLVLAAKYQFGQPSRKSAVNDPIFSSDPVLKFMADYTATRGRPLPHMVEKEYWYETLMKGVHAAILGQKPVDQALKDAQAEYTDRARRA
jgi:arabinogalactan oligomer/maltooligosaccharide transport system substrate-binding protein